MQLLRRAAPPPDTVQDASSCHWFEKAIPRAFAWFATSIYGLTGDRRGWLPLFTRTSAHLAVIIVAVIAASLSNVEWPTQAASISSMRTPLVSAGEGKEEGTVRTTDSIPVQLNEQNGVPPRTNSFNGSAAVISRLAQPQTIIPDRPRLGVITYTVQAGDTVQAIAASFNLDPTTIMWADASIEDAPDLLRIGQTVTILPVDGVYHKVAEGDTLESIAEKYKVEPDAIATCQYNQKPYVPKVVTTYSGSVPEGARGTGRFQWPVLGSITQGYWYGHRAIDIGASTGSAVLAADGGFVSFAGWTDVGYGYLVVIDHANGFATYYAHLNSFYVSTGQAVERGQVIGGVGTTGWSTGPHLHFEVRYYGAQQNPRVYLP
jgi:murein DD-endopeptidase MepM/ murein hydrolase activator NlpD